MSIYIKGMEMPTTGLYFVSVDNSNGRDKTVITVERMLGNRDVRQIVGSFELAPVPTPHGRLIDADGEIGVNITMMPGGKCRVDLVAPTIIPADKEGK